MVIRPFTCLLLLFACLGLAPSLGCVHLPACPAEGGPKWSEWRSPHFRLLTDVSDKAGAERLATQLEQFRAAIVAAAWRDNPEPPEPIEVVALRSAFETRAVQPMFVEGEFLWNEPVSFILTSATERLARAQTLKHETVHALMHQLGLDIKAPNWFCEGLAEYLATTDIDETTDRITFGTLPREPVIDLRQGGLATWEELWLMKELGWGVFRQRATGWLLVHYLFNREKERFARYQNGLAQVQNAQAWWLEVFPELTADTFSHRLSEYWEAGEYAKYQAIIPRPHFNFVERTLPDAEIHAILAMLWISHKSQPDALMRARQDLREALRLDPMNLRARIIERFFMKENQGDLPTAQLLTRTHPRDWRAWLLLAAAFARDQGQTEAAAALQQARVLGYQERKGMPSLAAAPY